MTQAIGELFLESGKPLLKMWQVLVPAGERPFTKHSHTRFEITVVNSGSGEYTTENAVYPMEAGDVFVFSSKEVHQITRAGEEGLSITNLHFEPRYLGEEFSDSFGDSYIHFCFSHSPQFRNRIPAHRAAELRENHRRIKEEFLQGEEEYPLAIRAHLHLMLIDLLRRHQYRSPVWADKKSTLFDMLSVYDYIDSHLEEELTLPELAGLAGLTPNYFSHLFKQLNGSSLWDYITAKRIEKAVRLLRNGEGLTILEIALRCGFNNTANFNKAFKKQKGITPSQLRRDPKLLSH